MLGSEGLSCPAVGPVSYQTLLEPWRLSLSLSLSLSLARAGLTETHWLAIAESDEAGSVSGTDNIGTLETDLWDEAS